MKNSKKFKRGTVVVWDSLTLNPEFWKNLSEADRIKYYEALGYGRKNPKLFVFLTEIKNKDGDTGHCVLVDLDDGHLEVMRHTCEFRKATDEEF